MKTSTYFKISIGMASMAILGCFSASAQITLQESDMISIGGTYVLANDTAPALSVHPGAEGAANWNLTGLKNDYQDTAWGETPSTVPYYSDFSAYNPNLALKINENGAHFYGFAIKSSTDLTTLGEAIAAGAEVILDKTNPAPIDVALPCTYRTTWKGTYRGVDKISAIAGDTEMAISSTSYIDSADGYGTLTTPAGSYSALRVIELSTELYDSVYEYNSVTKSYDFLAAQPASPQTEGVEWFGNGTGYPLASLAVATVQGQNVTSGVYLISSKLGVDEIADNSTANVYPNPASSLVNMDITSASPNGYIRIFDLTGREIETTPFRNGKAQFNVSNYAIGMYLYQVIDMNGTLLNQGKFCVNR
jgi:hypothetical protein